MIHPDLLIQLVALASGVGYLRGRLADLVRRVSRIETQMNGALDRRLLAIETSIRETRAARPPSEGIQIHTDHSETG